MIVDINGLAFQERGTSGFVFQTFSDWYSIAESKSEIRERPQQYGAFGIDGEPRASLALVLEASYLGSDVTDAALAKRQLKRALATNTTVQCAVTDVLGLTTREVSVRRAPIPDDHGRTVWSTAIEMIALDPRRYGPELVTQTGLATSGGGLVWPITYPIDWGTPGDPGRLTVSNPGDEETVPLLEVDGGLDAGFELINTSNGRRVRFERVVPVGSTIFIDQEQGLAWIDDPANDVSRYLSRREWWSVAPGESVGVQFESLGTTSGTPIFRARTRPAY